MLSPRSPRTETFLFDRGESYEREVELDLTINGRHKVWGFVENDSLGPGGTRPVPARKAVEIDPASSDWRQSVDRALEAHRLTHVNVPRVPR